jgi:hypothetical protein
MSKYVKDSVRKCISLIRCSAPIEAAAKQTFCVNQCIGVETSECITKSHTRQPAQTAERNVKFRSSQTQAGQFTAENVTLNEDHHEDTKLIKLTS